MKYLILIGSIAVFLFLSYWSIMLSTIYIAERNGLISNFSSGFDEVEEHPEILDRIMTIFYGQLKAYLLAIVVAAIIFYLGWRLAAG